MSVSGVLVDLGMEMGDGANVCVGVDRKVYVSFGGLLLFLEGPYKNLTPLRIDYLYLCMKKSEAPSSAGDWVGSEEGKVRAFSET